jgi:hypothetical protein
MIVGSHSQFPMTVRSESRQEERKDGGQILGVRSERKIRPSLDQGEPARSLKCKEKRVYKIPKEGGPSIYGQDTWTQINISLTGKSKFRNAPTSHLSKSRYAKSRFNLAVRSRCDLDRRSDSISEFRGSGVGDVKEHSPQECPNRDMRNRDLITAVRSRCDLDRRLHFGVSRLAT